MIPAAAKPRTALTPWVEAAALEGEAEAAEAAAVLAGVDEAAGAEVADEPAEAEGPAVNVTP